MSNATSASKKRRRELYNVDVKLVEIYEDLANENDNVRITAASELVTRFTPESQPSDELIQKTLTRLFRGLCSGRKAARIGFSIALTEILSQVFGQLGSAASLESNISRVLQIWESTSDASGSDSGQVRYLFRGRQWFFSLF
jgi:DNA polymerase phi